MITEVLPAETAANLSRAAALLRAGELVAFPTDTVYGLAADAFNAYAVAEIFTAKRRPSGKAIPVLLASITQLDLVCVEPSRAAMQLARRFWPGPLTIVVRAHPSLPSQVSEGTVGVRIPDHPVALALIASAGPLAVTSANESGGKSALTAAEAQDQLGGRIPLILDGGLAPGGVPSTVVDCTGLELKILREGPLDLRDLQAALA